MLFGFLFLTSTLPFERESVQEFVDILNCHTTCPTEEVRKCNRVKYKVNKTKELTNTRRKA